MEIIIDKVYSHMFLSNKFIFPRLPYKVSYFMIVILKLFCYTNRRSNLLLHRRALGYYHQNFSLTGYHGITQAIYTFISILSSSISTPALPGPLYLGPFWGSPTHPGPLYLSPFWDPLPFWDHYI